MEKLMLICPICKETFSGSAGKYYECTDCKSELKIMRIKIEDRRELSDEQKVAFKDSELEIIKSQKKNSFYYSNNDIVPFNYHKYNLILRVPISIFYSFYQMHMYKEHMIDALFLIILLIVFEITGWKKSKISFYSILIIDAFFIAIGFLDIKLIGFALGAIIESIYYLRRKNILLKAKENKSQTNKEVEERVYLEETTNKEQFVDKQTKSKSCENKTKTKERVLIILLILLSLLASGLGYGMYYNYETINLTQDYYNKEIEKLKKEINSIKLDASSNKSKALYFDNIKNYAKLARSYSDFYARQTILVKPDKQKVWIYYNHNNSSVYYETSSIAIKAERGDFNGPRVPLTITYKGSGVGYVKITNDVNNEKIYIVVIGD